MSSRSRRRGSRGHGRPQRRARRLPLVPLVAVVVVVGVVALIAFVVTQSGGGSGSSNEDAIAAEADRDPALPGEFVDLVEIYGGPYNETAGHVSVAVDYEADGNSNPPAGGPHWSGSCGEDPSEAPPFCGPAPWGVFREEWQPETLVHNMEHGGAVVWYNTDDQDVIDTLEALVEQHLLDDDIVVMAPYSGMEDDTIAVTSWSRIDKFPTSEFTEARVEAFLDAHVRRFNPEDF